MEEENSCEETESLYKIQQIKRIGVGKQQEMDEEVKLNIKEEFDCGKDLILDEWSKYENIEQFHFGCVICALVDEDFGNFGEESLKMKFWDTFDDSSHDHLEEKIFEFEYLF